MNTHPLNIVVGSIVQDGTCLLIRRVKEPYKNFWSIPGGKLEFGEDIASAITREFLEETGTEVSFSGVRGVVSEIIKDRAADTATNHFLIWVCGLGHVSGEAVSQKEGEVAWFSESKLDACKAEIIPSDYLMLKRFFFSDVGPTRFHSVLMRSHGDGKYKIEHTDL